MGYESNGRCGYVVFSHRGTRFSLYYEFAGGDALAVIDVPSAHEWKRKTGLSLAARDPLLRFIGATVARDQTANHAGTYVLGTNTLTIYASRMP